MSWASQKTSYPKSAQIQETILVFVIMLNILLDKSVSGSSKSVWPTHLATRPWMYVNVEHVNTMLDFVSGDYSSVWIL